MKVCQTRCASLSLGRMRVARLWRWAGFDHQSIARRVSTRRTSFIGSADVVSDLEVPRRPEAGSVRLLGLDAESKLVLIEVTRDQLLVVSDGPVLQRASVSLGTPSSEPSAPSSLLVRCGGCEVAGEAFGHERNVLKREPGDDQAVSWPQLAHIHVALHRRSCNSGCGGNWTLGHLLRLPIDACCSCARTGTAPGFAATSSHPPGPIDLRNRASLGRRSPNDPSRWQGSSTTSA